MNPNLADHGLEGAVLATIAWWATDRELVFGELRARDFNHPEHRELFVRMARAHVRGALRCRLVVDEPSGTVRHAWDGLSDGDSAHLAKIVETSAQLYAFGPAIEQLQALTKRRAIVAAAERVLAGETVPDPVLTFLLSDEAA